MMSFSDRLLSGSVRRMDSVMVQSTRHRRSHSLWLNSIRVNAKRS
ncbi:hypothetical protein [Nostoc sp.]